MRFLVVSADRSDSDGMPINLGDAFLTDALLEALHQRGHLAEAVDFGGVRDPSQSPRMYLSGIRPLRQAIGACDAVIVGGGTMIQEDSANLWRGSLMRLCMAIGGMAALTRRPLRLYAVGVDPLPRAQARIGYRLALSGAQTWVRDAESQRRYASYFGKTPGLAGDAALLLPVNDPLAASSPRERRLVLAPNYAHSSQLTADLIHAFASTVEAVDFVAMSRGGEYGDHRGIAPEALASFDRVSIRGGLQENLALLAGASVVIASRMHALYFAALNSLPMVAVGTSTKVSAFAREFQIPQIGQFGDYRAGMETSADPQMLGRARIRAEQGLDELLDSVR